MDATRSQRIEFLDSIRGLAALTVLFSHAVGALFAPAFMLPLLQTPWLRFTIDGKAAVAMFFVLSGYVLSRPYFKPFADGQPRPIRLLPFYIKRITRIYFPFICALTASALANLWLFRRWETIPVQTDWFYHFWSVPWTARDFLKQCFFQLHNADQQLIVQDWSLGVELKASALLPFLVLAFRRNAWLLAVIGLLFFWLVGTGYYYLGFMLGIFAAAPGEWLLAKIRGQKFAAKCLLLLAGLALYDARSLLYAATHSVMGEKWIWMITSAGCVLILLACFSSRRIQRVLEHKAIVFLGRISYGVYLLQILVLLVFTPWFVHQINRAGWQSPAPVWFVGIIVSVAVTILLGAIFFELVEKPSMQLGHKLAARYGPKQAVLPLPETAPVTREP